MSTSDILRAIMAVCGVLLLFLSISSLSRRRMTEPFCLAWGFFSLLLILGGLLLQPVLLSAYISNTGLILIVLVGGVVILAAYWVCSQLSTQIRKNLELSMQISLLNEEIKRLQKEVGRIEGEQESREEQE